MQLPSAVCNGTIGQAAPALSAFQSRYQAANPFNLSASNPNYLMSDMQNGVNLPLGLFASDYQTPRSLQMNIGFQREVARGTILTVDYLRNVTTQLLLGIDINHVGDVKYSNKSAAIAAVNATLQQFNAKSIDRAVKNGATMVDFANNGSHLPGARLRRRLPIQLWMRIPGHQSKRPGIIGSRAHRTLDLRRTGVKPTHNVVGDISSPHHQHRVAVSSTPTCRWPTVCRDLSVRAGAIRRHRGTTIRTM
jgi:hypothetical protein